MYIMRALILAAAAAILMPGSAQADPRNRYVPCCDVLDYNWTGFFVGGHAAVAISQIDWAFPAVPDSTQHDDTGFGGGVHVGYQRQWERMVAGVEVSYTWVNMEETTTPATLAQTVSSSVSDLLIIAAKLGYAQDRWLAYAKAGYASADIELRTAVASSSEREHGWMMGIGMDYAFSHKVVLGVEYDWAFFSIGDRTVGAVLADGSGDIQTLMARLTFRFGRDEPQPMK